MALTSVSPFKVVVPSTRSVESNEISLIACTVLLNVATPSTPRVFFKLVVPATIRAAFNEASPSTMIFLSNVAFSANCVTELKLAS